MPVRAGAAVLVLLAALPVATADDHRTPRAGESVKGTLFGSEVEAPARDRRKITYLSVGAVLAPDGPQERTFGPMGGLYLWRVPEDGESRLRAIVAVISNEVRWDTRLAKDSGLSFVLSLDSLTLPWARSEVADGTRVAAGEMEASQARGGVGLAWRRSLSPGECDNGLDLALTFEPGALWFHGGSDTAPTWVLPEKTFEGRLHLRARADALTRNLLELPHAGWSAGADAVGAARSTWKAWGLPSAGLESGGKSWVAASVFGFLALPPWPGASERHRLIASAHAGVGSDLDRFSAFRLGGGSTWGDFETLSRLVLPGAGVDEIYTARYGIVDLEYRYEALFFLYLQLRGTLAWARLPEAVDGVPVTNGGPFPAITAGLTSGLPWGLALELSGSWNSGLSRSVDGRLEKGRFGALVSLTKEF